MQKINQLSLITFFKNSRFIKKNIFITSCKYFSALASEQVKRINKELTSSKFEYVNPFRKPDYFEVNDLFSIQDLFNARVHYGHKISSLNSKMIPYIFGQRLGYTMLDLEQTAINLRIALNFIAHMAYRDAIFLFVSNYHQHCMTIENTARECQEFSNTRTFTRGLFTDSNNVFKATIRHPDVVILLNTLNDALHEHSAVTQAAKMNIPTVAIVDSNTDPTIITYPIPGNDDSVTAIELYCKLFKIAILKGKNYRREVLSRTGVCKHS